MMAAQVFFPPFRLDPSNQRLWRDSDAIPLRPKTFAMLCYLIERSGKLVSHHELLTALWPDVQVDEGAPRACIRELRRALGDDAKRPQFIETQPVRGYRFIGKIVSHQEAASKNNEERNTQQFAARRSRLPTQHAALTTHHAVVVGRTAAMAQLHEWFTNAQNGQRQMVFVTGEPGIGKTTLVETFLAETKGAEVAWGQCVEQYGTGEAYLPILEALERLGRELDNDALRPLLSRYAPTWLVHLSSLITPAEREDLLQQLAGVKPDRMLRELAQALEILTSEQPLILWLEDLHWSDQATLTLLTALARRPELARLMIIGTYHPNDVLSHDHRLREVHQELQLHGHCHELAVESLNEEHIVEYLTKRFPAETTNQSPRQQLARLLHQRTEGNPLFISTVIDGLLAQGAMIRRNGGWDLKRATEAVSSTLPSLLRQFLELQIDRLTPADQRLLEAASVAGVEFPVALVAAGVAGSNTEIEEHCATLVRQGQFLQPRGSEAWPDGTVATRYGFPHSLYQEVLYERTPAGRRVEIHRRMGERHEAAYGDRAHEIATALAMHFERGHEYSRAVYHLEEAGKNALRRNAHHEAILHLSKGNELLASLPATPEHMRRELSLQLTLGTALMATKGFAAPEVEHAYLRARELCQQVDEPRHLCSVLWGLRTHYNGRAQFHTARDIAEQLLAVAQQLNDPALLVEAHRALGNTLYFQGEVAAAHEHFAQGSALYDIEQHRSLALLYENDPGVGCLSFAAVALWNLGYPDRARQRIQEALQLAQEVKHPGSQAVSLSLSAALQQNLREVQTVREQAEALIALARQHGFSGWLAPGTINRGWALAQQGEVAEGIESIHRGLMTMRTVGVELNRPRLLMMLSEACAQAGKPDEGLTALSEALEVMERTGGRLYEAELYRLKGELLLQLSG